MGRNPVNRSKTLAKIVLLFFAVLFTAVLIHPNVDLLDVHDVKISNARSQIGPGEGWLIPSLPVLFARPPIDQSSFLSHLRPEEQNSPSGTPSTSSILRL
jgi:hypothetical protein